MTDARVATAARIPPSVIAWTAGLAAAGAILPMLLHPTFGLYVVEAVALVAGLATAGLSLFAAAAPADIPVRAWLLGPATRLALVAFAAALVTLPFAVMSVAGEGLPGLGSGLARSAALRSGDYETVLARAAGLIAVTAGLRASGRRARPLCVVGALLITGSFLLTGHARTHTPAVAVAAAVFTHVTAAAAWFGGLVGLALSMRRSRGDLPTSGRLLATFARAMAVVLALLLAAGVGLAVLYLPSPGALVHTAYGQVLLVKLAVLGGVLVLSTANHLRLVPSAAAGNARAVAVLRANIAAEQVGLLAILVITEVLMRQNPGG